ncbi:hypothetical protein ACH5RR_003531 [Cinchona calisaya]|uniref:Uncharacterized protein n=1 Tax=Cinchona calisaya TaxID=153742 RepID=A0ABD3AVA5_9GENT
MNKNGAYRQKRINFDSNLWLRWRLDERNRVQIIEDEILSGALTRDVQLTIDNGIGPKRCIIEDEIHNGALTKDVWPTIDNGIGQGSFTGLQICKNMDVNDAEKLSKSKKSGTYAFLEHKKMKEPCFLLRQNQGFKDTSKSLSRPSLNFLLNNALRASGAVLPFNDEIVERQRTCWILHKPPEPSSSVGSEYRAKCSGG